MSPRRSSVLSRIRGTRPSQRLLAVLALLLLLSGSAAVLSAATFTATTPGQVTVGAAEDYTPPTAAMTVAPVAAGTIALTVDAQDARTFVTGVVVEKRPTGGTWTPLCTTTSAPWTCDWDTTGEADGEVSLRATATDSVDLTGTSPVVTTLVDNTAPAASLAMPSPLRGTVLVDPAVADAGSGIASVTLDHRTGAGTWVTLCTRTVSPYGCALDTTTLTTGATYEFRVTARDVAGNTRSATATAVVDNTTGSVSITGPGAGGFVRETTTITVAASTSPGTVGSVAVEQRRVGTSAWSPICTDTSAPYSCPWNVGGAVPSGAYELRAVMTHGFDNRTLASATVTPVYVDNTPPRASDVHATLGGTPGTLDDGDSFVFTYSTLLDLDKIRTGWTGGTTAVPAVLYGKNTTGGPVANQDWLDITGIGPIAFSQDVIVPAKSATTTMTLTAETFWDPNGLPRTRITATAGPFTGDKPRTGVGAGTMTWAPASTTRTTDNRAISSTAVTESGGADGDL